MVHDIPVRVVQPDLGQQYHRPTFATPDVRAHFTHDKKIQTVMPPILKMKNILDKVQKWSTVVKISANALGVVKLKVSMEHKVDLETRFTDNVSQGKEGQAHH